MGDGFPALLNVLMVFSSVDYLRSMRATSALVLAAQGVPGNGTCAELARVLFIAGARLDAADAAALALYRFGSAVSVVKSEIGAR